MSRDKFIRRACADLGITVFALDVPDNANTNQIMKAIESALEREFGKEE